MGSARRPTTSEMMSRCWSSSLVQSIVKRFAAARNLMSQDLQAQPLGEIFGPQPRVVNQPRELFHGGLLIALRPRQFGLATGLFVKDRKDELGDRFELMAVSPGQHLFDKLCDACRLNLCCHITNRITQVV